MTDMCVCRWKQSAKELQANAADRLTKRHRAQRHVQSALYLACINGLNRTSYSMPCGARNDLLTSECVAAKHSAPDLPEMTCLTRCVCTDFLTRSV